MVKVFKGCWKYAGAVYTSPVYFQQPFEHFNHLNALITNVAWYMALQNFIMDGSGNGLSSVRYQAITWANADLL